LHNEIGEKTNPELQIPCGPEHFKIVHDEKIQTDVPPLYTIYNTKPPPVLGIVHAVKFVDSKVAVELGVK
jgi:hypothetical protein